MSGIDQSIVSWFIPGMIGVELKHGDHDQSTHGTRDGSSINLESGGTFQVYHGTNADFDKFELSPTVSGNEMGAGVYFTVDRDRAAGYGKNIHEVKATVNNPISVNSDKPISQSLADQANEYIGDKEVITENEFDDLADVRKFRDEIGSNLYAMDQRGDKFVVYAKQKGVSSKTPQKELYKIIRNAYPQSSSQVLGELGFDGIVSDRDIIVFNPNQIDYD